MSEEIEDFEAVARHDLYSKVVVDDSVVEFEVDADVPQSAVRSAFVAHYGVSVVSVREDEGCGIYGVSPGVWAGWLDGASLMRFYLNGAGQVIDCASSAELAAAEELSAEIAEGEVAEGNAPEALESM